MGWLKKKKDETLDEDLPKANFDFDEKPFGGLTPRPNPLDPSTEKNRDHELILAKLDTLGHRLDAIEKRLAEIERIAKSE